MPETPINETESTDFTPQPIHERNIPVVRQLIVALGVLGVVFGSTYIGTIATVMHLRTPDPTVRIEATLAEGTKTEPLQSKNFNDVKVVARSAFVWDVQAGRALFSKNPDERLPLASITKLMTALVAHELLDSDATINISVDAIREDGDSGFSDGEAFSLRDLTDLVLMASSNDGAHALSAATGNALTDAKDPNAVFVSAMNLKAEELGLQNTHFTNVTGLDVSQSEAGAYGSARDIALLMEYIITRYPDLVALTKTELTTIDDTEGKYHIVKNTNEIVDQIPGLIASKTGYTELAGGNLVIAYDAGFNHPIIISVLGSTQEGRFNDVLLLAERARSYVSESQ